ncbi:MAG TPA: SusD/RagB family nutrient-binding outer membrane lipoprotein [Chitinophagaceae bacterium]|nr:SusD/RagB family nutrient-binding outer membrane lipoprotein [Chitinophagaceae bacterium]
MKSTRIYIFALLLVALASCSKKFEDLQINPNRPTSVPASLILTKQLNDLAGGLGGVEPWGAVARYNQYYCRNYQYYGDNAYSWSNGPFGVYTAQLKNIMQMEDEAKKSGAKDINPYASVAKFLKAYYFYHLTSLMGDVPMTEAIKGTTGIFAPKYDDQKAVFVQVLKWLEEANTEFATYTIVDAFPAGVDIYYGNDFTKWRKLVNSFKLRVLVALSKHENDADLKVKQRFSETIAAPASFPIFTGMGDNLRYVYNATINRYPFNPSNFGFDALRLNMAEAYVKACTQINDPRVLVTCDPAWKIATDNGYSLTDFRSFVGAPIGQNQSQMEADAIAGRISMINRYRYYRTFTAEDFIIVGYPEMCFNIAEGIARGWASGNVNTWYQNGIRASVNFYGIVNGNNTAYYLRSGSPTNLADYTSASFTYSESNYMTQTSVQLEGNLSADLSKIVTQKYIAMFQNSGWEPYFNFRRTGFPTLTGGVGIGNGGVLPKRWAYATAEQNVNNANWKAALTKQGFNNDDLNGLMWLIK